MYKSMSEELTYIKCGKYYDGIHDELKKDWKILVKGKYIAETGPSLECPESAKVIDLSDATVTPGMIDAHMHMDFFDWHTVRQEAYHNSEELKTISIVRCAQKALKRGFTSVRHMGGITSNGYGVFAVRDSIEKGYITGARIVAAASFLCSPGSHGDLTQEFAGYPDVARLLQAERKTLGSGRDFFTNAVREEVKYGTDFIKIMATGGFFTPNDSPLQKQLNDQETEAIIQTAHELGTTVTAHVYAPAQMQSLVKNKIDGLEHGALMDRETAQMIEESGTYLVPTFSPYDEAVHYDPEKIALKQPEFRAKLEYYKDALIAGREEIRKSHIKLGYGTDFVANHQNYESGWEYDAWLRSGMDPFRALKAATKNNAEILGIADKTGTLEPGKLADIAAWKKDLMTDSQALLDCAFVMKEGTVYETEKSE